MKSLNLFLIIALVLFSCHKDKISIDIHEEDPSPKKIGAVNIEGTIKNIDGVLLPNVLITAFQNNRKAGSVWTNQFGYYSTKSIPLDPEQAVTLEFNKEEYDLKYRRFSEAKREKITANLLMGNAETPDVKEEPVIWQNPSDTGYVKLWGYAKLSNGTPVRGVKFTALWEFRVFTSLLWGKGPVHDYSDENGYFELLVPKDRDIYLNSYYQRFSNDIFEQCIIEFQNIVPNELDRWRYNFLGQFDNDHEVPLRNDIEIDLIMITFKGKAQFCDGTPVQKGILYGAIGIRMGNDTNGGLFPHFVFTDSNFNFGPNGEFEFYLEGCRKPNLNYGFYIRIRTLDYEGELRKFELNSANGILDVKLCYDLIDYPDELYYKLGNDPIRYLRSGGDNPYSGLDHLTTGFDTLIGDYKETIYFAVENFKLGEQAINNLQLWKSSKDPNFNSWVVFEITFITKPEDVILTITGINGRYVEGNIIGSVATINQGILPLEIYFNIYNK
ncbi:MAG: hypothetical protein IPM48_03535 [Saprospiraceae bacterium]|nr:hypothetical protein [Saprospiraceae bacterium]